MQFDIDPILFNQLHLFVCLIEWIQPHARTTLDHRNRMAGLSPAPPFSPSLATSAVHSRLEALRNKRGLISARLSLIGADFGPAAASLPEPAAAGAAGGPAAPRSAALTPERPARHSPSAASASRPRDAVGAPMSPLASPGGWRGFAAIPGLTGAPAGASLHTAAGLSPSHRSSPVRPLVGALAAASPTSSTPAGAGPVTSVVAGRSRLGAGPAQAPVAPAGRAGGARALIPVAGVGAAVQAVAAAPQSRPSADGPRAARPSPAPPTTPYRSAPTAAARAAAPAPSPATGSPAAAAVLAASGGLVLDDAASAAAMNVELRAALASQAAEGAVACARLEAQVASLAASLAAARAEAEDAQQSADVELAAARKRARGAEAELAQAKAALASAAEARASEAARAAAAEAALAKAQRAGGSGSSAGGGEGVAASPREGAQAGAAMAAALSAAQADAAEARRHNAALEDELAEMRAESESVRAQAEVRLDSAASPPQGRQPLPPPHPRLPSPAGVCGCPQRRRSSSRAGALRVARGSGGSRRRARCPARGCLCTRRGDSASGGRSGRAE